MRRFVTFFVLLLFSVPFGISISGCAKKTTVTYCNASSGDAGVQVGQLVTIVLQPRLYGISLNYGQIGQLSSPSGTDCTNASVAVSTYTYGYLNPPVGKISPVDVNPANGALCAGTWNRNLNVIPDYTVCTPLANPDPNNSVAYLTAEAAGVTSNPIPVFTHPVVTSVVLDPNPSACVAGQTPQTTNCCPLALSANNITADPYQASSCLSQGSTAQLAARVFANGQNISCQIGHLTFAAQTPGILSIDENGVATAQQPGSTVINASVANAGSSAGFFSTCPPVSINLSVPNTTATSITVNQNFSQPLVATAVDLNGHSITGLALEYVSTTPTTIPVASNGIVTPQFPGGASITAICQPPTCNPAPFNQIGLPYGPAAAPQFQNNGKPITSNPIGITTPGANSTLLYIASTQSRYLVPVDFTTTTLGAPVLLPYAPNSMVISQDGTSIYMGTSTELMVFSASSNGITREDVSVPGTVLSVSPDNQTVVISDPARKTIYLEASGGGVVTQFGGIATHAQWTPDSQRVYITAADPTTGADQLLVHSAFTGWNNITPTVLPLDVAVTVPSVGAYFAGAATTAVGYCPASVPTTVNGQTTVANVFDPPADTVATATDRIAATNDGKHILGVSAATRLLSDLRVTLPTGQCPASGAALQFSAGGTSTPFTTVPLPGIAPSAVTGVLPASDSGVAVLTYTGTGGVLPVYAPSPAAAATPGTVTNVALSGAATAPVAGVWSTDNLTFFTGTSGDNLVHLITRASSAATLSDTKTIAPALPATGGGTATPNLLVQKPRKTT